MTSIAVPISFTMSHIKWVDSNGFQDGGWQSMENLDGHEHAEINTCGFVWSESSDYVTIIMSYDDGQNFMGAITIPKCCIIDRSDFIA